MKRAQETGYFTILETEYLFRSKLNHYEKNLKVTLKCHRKNAIL